MIINWIFHDFFLHFYVIKNNLGRHGKKLWENLVWDMTSLGLITSIDWATFELCCSSYDLYMEAKELIYKPMNKETNRPRRQSLAEYLDHGDPKAIRILNQSYDRFMAAVKALGLSPAARKNIVIEKPETQEISDTAKILQEVGF
jgi:P27 family predicted phage terminase small subunit